MCSRSFASGQVERLRTLGYQLLVGFEVEWYVDAGGGSELLPACSGPAYGARRVVELSDYCRDLLSALAAEGVQVQQLHPEYASGQLELSVAAEDPVGAADTTVLVRQTILAVSATRGLRVSFAPMVIADHVGNGGHVHLSLWRDSRNLMSDGPHRLTAEGKAFVAGVLAELPALLAVGAPSVSSYLRLVPQRWAGAFQCWGWENREAAIRMISGPVGTEASSANVEVKCFDQSANPYLAVGALIAAGLTGLVRGDQLPPPVDVDPASLDDEERHSRGIERLPQRLEDSAEAFLASTALTQAMGDQLADTIATVRRAESELFAGKEPAEIIAATRWRY
jgi:glutamine synthetase